MKLVSGARDWWRWHSTYAFAVLSALPVVWFSSPEIQALVPPHIFKYIAPAIGALGFVLRMRKQVPKQIEEETHK